MLESGWLWFYARMWWKDPANREHMRMLEELPAYVPPAPVAPDAGSHARHEEPAVCEGASRA